MVEETSVQGENYLPAPLTDKHIRLNIVKLAMVAMLLDSISLIQPNSRLTFTSMLSLRNTEFGSISYGGFKTNRQFKLRFSIPQI